MSRDNIPIYSSKRNFYFEERGYRDTDKCCSQAIFHDKCSKCDRCDHCCQCPNKFEFNQHKCDCGHEHCHSCHDDQKRPKKQEKPDRDYSLNFFDSDESDARVTQEGDQYAFMEQESAELIWVKESCNIEVNTTDTQVGISLQAALQLAIAVVINITIADSNRSKDVAQELLQYFDSSQMNKQKIYIYNTKDAKVTTTDTDLAVNLQVMLQVLVAILIMVDIL